MIAKMTKHTHGLSVTPSYPTCPICEEESDDDRGWCSRCEDFVSNQPTPKPLPPVRGTARQIMERIEERSLGNGWNRWAA